VITGLYIPGHSLLHRTPAGLKVSALLYAGIAIVLVGSIPVLSGAAALVIASYSALANLGVRTVWSATRGILIWLLFIALAQTWVVGVESAAVTMLRLLVLVWLASLITYTTRIDDMMAVLERGLTWAKPVGISPQRSAFLIALTIRLIPALFSIVREVQEGQRARGIESSAVSIVTPALTRVLAHADTVADALTARGFDRWDAQK